MPKVSVIIPVYNVERYLGECLDSILGQTLSDIEVLCVDDGSTDSSAKILADYVARDSRVKALSAPHGGAYRARAVGVAASSGEYLHFMDADDTLATEAYSRLVEQADRERLDQIVFSASVFTVGAGDAKRFADMKRRFERRYMISDEVVGRIRSGRDTMTALLDARQFFVSPPLRLIRSSVIKGHDWHMPKATSRVDNYFTPLSLLLSARANVVSARYYRRRVRMDSISTAAGSEQKHFRNLLEVLALYCSRHEFADELDDPKAPVARYAEIVVKNIGRLLPSIPPDDRDLIVGEVFADFPPATRLILRSGVLSSLARLNQPLKRRSRFRSFRSLVWRILARLGFDR